MLTSTAHTRDVITGCHDGDTCRLVSSAYTGNVRIYCIDAPEIGQEPWGRMARDALHREIRGTIRVVIYTTDRWGRPVAELIREDGRNIGIELVRAGHAAVHPHYCEASEYYAAEDIARMAKRGIWSSNGAHQRPWEWRAQRRSAR